MGRRRKKKEPSNEEAVFGVVVCIIGLFYFNQLGLASILSAALFIIGFFKISQSNDLETDKPKPKSKSKPKPKSKSPAEKDNIPARALSVISPARPTEWSEELIAKFDWRVFEKLCLKIWQAKGFSVKETGVGADGGVDFYLYANTTRQKIGVVQCKSWSKRQIDVKVLRELQGVVASEQLKLGLLMYSGVLSKGANEFMKKPAVNIKAQSGVDILTEIRKLSQETQAELLKKMTAGDYEKPSCPNCDIKLVRRTASKTQEGFWGCSNFPKCRYTMRGK